MKVAFDSRPIANPQGVGRYSRCLLQALRETAGACMEIIETHRPQRVDIFHAPWIEGAMLRSPCPMVVTLHDLAALKRRSEHLRLGIGQSLRHLAVQRALRVIVPTEAVAKDAFTVLGIDDERVVVIAEAPDPAMYPRTPREVAAARKRFALPDDYIVWAGSLQHPDPSTHVTKLAAAPRRLPLVLVGPTRPWAHELPNVTLTGQVSDEQLAAIYSGAHALVLPAHDEGFGLPAVEALACGTPVVACEGAALREVLDGRATFVEQGDLEALFTAAESAQRPAPPAPPWTWEDAARATWGVYGQAMALGDGAHGNGQPVRRRAERRA